MLLRGLARLFYMTDLRILANTKVFQKQHYKTKYTAVLAASFEIYQSCLNTLIQGMEGLTSIYLKRDGVSKCFNVEVKEILQNTQIDLELTASIVCGIFLRIISFSTSVQNLNLKIWRSKVRVSRSRASLNLIQKFS